MKEKEGDVTTLLLQLRESNDSEEAAWNRLYTSVYSQLRFVAAAIMRVEKPGHLLQPTALVHESYLKLLAERGTEWRDRVHFFGVATRAMREVLVDYARRRSATKRGGELKRVPLDEADGAGEDRLLEIIELDDALQRLKKLSQRTAHVVELRVFWGLSHEEIACVLSVSTRTIAGDWSFARRWLAREFAAAPAF